MTVDPGTSIADAVRELATAMLATSDLAGLLDRVVTVAAASLGPELSCGVTLATGPRTHTVAASDDRARRIDEIQYSGGVGPCLESLRTGLVVAVPDMRAETRWGAYPVRALADGVLSALALPMIAGGATLGALNLYSGVADVFDDPRRRDAAILAATGAGAVAMAVRLGEQVRLSTQLEAALASRAVIDQALGIIIAERRCTPDDAFTGLRTLSQQRNIKLRDVAAQLVRSAGPPDAATDTSL